MADANPNQIDISLSLLPGNSQAAVESLVNAMRSVAAQIAAVNAPDAAAAAAAMPGVFNHPSGIVHGVSGLPSTPPNADMSAAAQAVQDAYTQERAQAKLQTAARMADIVEPGGQTRLNIEAATPPPPTIQPPASGALNVPALEHAAAVAQQISLNMHGGDIPEARNSYADDDATGEMRVYVTNPHEFPKFEGAVVQDAVRATQPRAEREPSDSRRSDFSQNLAWSAITTFIQSHLMGNHIARGMEGGANDLFERQGLTNLGARLGADPIGTIGIPGTGIQVQNPVDIAQTMFRGLQARVSAMESGAVVPYMGMRESNRLNEAMINQGFSQQYSEEMIRALAQTRGGVGRTLTREGAFPILEQFGRLRVPNAVRELPRVVAAMGAAASRANMDMDEFAASANEFADQMQTMGGDYHQGLMEAANFSMQTGMDPRVGMMFRNNPMVQGLAFQQTGVLPQLQGNLPAAMMNDATMQSIDTLMSAFSGSFQDQEIQGRHGTRILTAEEQAMDMTAQMLGVNTEQIRQMLRTRNGEGQGAIGDLNDALETYESDLFGIEFDKTLTEDERRRRYAALDQETLRGEAGVGIQELMESARAAGLETKDFEGKTGADLTNAIRQAFETKHNENAEKGGDTRTQIEITLSGVGKRFFHAVEKMAPEELRRAMENSGGPRSDENRIGPSWLYPQNPSE